MKLLAIATPRAPLDIIAVDGDPLAIHNSRARALRHEGGAIYRNDTGQ